MQNFQEIQEKAFRDVKHIIAGLHRVSSPEEFKNRKHQLLALQELVTFLEVSDRYSSQAAGRLDQNIEIQDENPFVTGEFASPSEEKYIAEEEVLFNKALNQIDDSEIHHPEIENDLLEEEAEFNNRLNEIETLALPEEDEESFRPAEFENGQLLSVSEELPGLRSGVTVSGNDQTDADDDELRNTRGKIVDFEREEKMQELNEAAALIQEQHEEKKLKLAHIKGLKKIQSFFEEDPLEELKEIEESRHESVAGSLLRSNVRTDFMEAEKPKNEFKLDLNDRIAFSKMLFTGNESKMNETIDRLNSFKTLEEAREYLSEAYYTYHWEKSDEYAQRLWNLVENKFI